MKPSEASVAVLPRSALEWFMAALAFVVAIGVGLSSDARLGEYILRIPWTTVIDVRIFWALLLGFICWLQLFVLVYCHYRAGIDAACGECPLRQTCGRRIVILRRWVNFVSFIIWTAMAITCFRGGLYAGLGPVSALTAIGHFLISALLTTSHIKAAR